MGQRAAAVRPGSAIALVFFTILAAVILAPSALAVSYVVGQEQAVVGTTSGISGAQAPDGVLETLREADTAPDPTTYPSTQTIATGTQVAGTFPSSIQAPDNNYIQYREASTGASVNASKNPSALGTCNFIAGINGTVSDNHYAISPNATDSCAYTTFGFSVPAGSSITKVELGYEAYTSGDDKWSLSLSWDGGTSWCTFQQTVQLPPADPNSYTYMDFTNCGSHTWVASDFSNIASRFDHFKNKNVLDTNYLDANVIRVTYIPAGGYQLEVHYSWSTVPSGQAYTLSVKGHISNESMWVQVLTPATTWNTRLTISSTTDQVLTYNLTTAEFNAGGPAIRFLDALGPDPVQSDLWLDEVKIITTVLDYRLDVRQNVTGIVGVSPVLQIEGNISAGGENFNVYVWNFTIGGWDQRLASPFTATNAYHNASLPPDDISGGTVRIRFVDVVASDTVQQALSLDLVQISTSAGNAPPGLSNNGVVPASGNISTSFVFYVRYTDVDNDAPQYVRLRVNGSVYDMVANGSSTNYAAGKDYHLNLTIGLRGTFTYDYTTRAATGNTSVVNSPSRQVQVVDRPPSITNPLASQSYHVRLYLRTFTATDPDGDPLTWSLATNASWLTVGAGNGTVWGNRPLGNYSYHVNVTVRDPYGLRDFDNYTLTVGNIPPKITTAVGNTSGFRTPFARTMGAYDADGDSLTWSLATNASFLSIDPATGALASAGTPSPGVYYLRVTVADGFGGSATVNFTATFLNRPPSISGTPLGTGAGGASYGADFAGTDPDGDPLTWSLETNATWLSMASPGHLVGTGVPGVYYVNVTARDPYGGVSYRNYTLTVKPAAGGGVFESMYPWTLLGVVAAAAVVLACLLAYRRKPKGDVVLKAYLFTDKAVVLQEFYSDQEDPPVAFKDIFKFLVGGKVPGDHWLDLPPYRVAVVQEGEVHLAAVSRIDKEPKVMAEAHRLLLSLLGDVDIKAALPQAEFRPPASERKG